MERIRNLKRTAVIALALVFGAAVVAGYFQHSGWPADVEAIELSGSEAARGAPAAPVAPARDAADEEAITRRDDDSQSDVADDEDEDDEPTGGTGVASRPGKVGDGDGTRGDDGTAGGNNTRNTNSGTGSGTDG